MIPSDFIVKREINKLWKRKTLCEKKKDVIGARLFYMAHELIRWAREDTEAWALPIDVTKITIDLLKDDLNAIANSKEKSK